MNTERKSEPQAVKAPAEALITLQAAAEALGQPYFKLQRAARAKLIPTYTLLNSRRLVRLSEVIEVIERSRQGGAQ